MESEYCQCAYFDPPKILTVQFNTSSIDFILTSLFLNDMFNALPLIGICILRSSLMILCAAFAIFSENDWDQMRLAAAKSVLRLSRRWDLHIAPETFCCTVLMAKVLTLLFLSS